MGDKQVKRVSFVIYIDDELMVDIPMCRNKTLIEVISQDLWYMQSLLSEEPQYSYSHFNSSPRFCIKSRILPEQFDGCIMIFPDEPYNGMLFS